MSIILTLHGRQGRFPCWAPHGLHLACGQQSVWIDDVLQLPGYGGPAWASETQIVANAAQGNEALALTLATGDISTGPGLGHHQISAGGGKMVLPEESSISCAYIWFRLL